MGLRLVWSREDNGIERQDPLAPTAADVHREAARRLRLIGYHGHRVRSLGTGKLMPDAIRHFKMQVDFVAETLSAQTPIPADFAEDRYWPRLR